MRESVSVLSSPDPLIVLNAYESSDCAYVVFILTRDMIVAAKTFRHTV
jgi:hypothetical protein